MTNSMMKKIENLRNLLGEKGMPYSDICNLVFRNNDLPSMTTLHKFNLLKVVRVEEWEETMTEDEWEWNDMNDDDSSEYWDWDEDRNLWVCEDSLKYYGV